MAAASGADELQEIARRISPYPIPDVANSWDLCAHALPWPCPTAEAAWIARGLGRAEQITAARRWLHGEQAEGARWVPTVGSRGLKACGSRRGAAQSWIISTVSDYPVPLDASDESGQRAGELVFGYVSVRHSVRAVVRDALAYSNIRRLWWPLAYLDLPLLAMIFGGVLALQPDKLVTFGHASAQLDHSWQGDVAAPAAPRTARWGLALAPVGLFTVVVAVAPMLIFAAFGAATAMLIWWLVIVGVPFIGYVVPSLLLQHRVRGLDDWKTATLNETGRMPVLASMLGTWPCKGGGKKNVTGDGFELIRELAHRARASGQIIVGAARTEALAQKYVAKTGAEPSSHNPRHLRWP